MKKALAVLFCVCVFMLAACSLTPVEAPSPAPAPEASDEPSPVPAPDPRDAVTELVLTGDAELSSLAEYKNLEYVNADACTDYAALCALKSERPELVVEWHASVAGISVSSLDTSIDLAGCAIDDIDRLENELMYLPCLERVYLIDSGLEDMQCRTLADDMPQLRFVWMLHFAEWTVRTDITCFSSTRDPSVSVRYNDYELAPLFTYCKELVALDLGHNKISDLTPIGELGSLKYLILADNAGIRDISPLAKLTELEYLELFMCYFITDYSPLGELSHMKAINLCHNSSVSSLSFAENMPELEMLWIMDCSVSAEDVQACKDAHPDAQIVTYTGSVSSTSGGWRASGMNIGLRNAFSNWRTVDRLVSWDDVSFIE